MSLILFGIEAILNVNYLNRGFFASIRNYP
jgi:hypothetical protein